MILMNNSYPQGGKLFIIRTLFTKNEVCMCCTVCVYCDVRMFHLRHEIYYDTRNILYNIHVQLYSTHQKNFFIL